MNAAGSSRAGAGIPDLRGGQDEARASVELHRSPPAESVAVDPPHPPPPIPSDLSASPAAADDLSLHHRFGHQWEFAHLPVRAFLTAFLSTPAAIDDCVQEVALLAWKKGPIQEDSDRFKAFCLACARRIAMAEVRKKYRRRHRHLEIETLTAVAEAAAHAASAETAAADRLRALRECLSRLDGKARHLLDLRYANSDPEALKSEAAKAGLSVDAIYKKLERLRSLLRNCVAKKLNPPDA